MPSYTLELELFSSYVTDVPEFEIWADGVLLGSSYSVTSGGFSISVAPSYGGSLPSSLEFRFNDVSVEVPRTIEIRSVKINNQYVNTGNYLSSDSLTNGSNSTVDIASVDTNDSDFLFDDSDPAGSEFMVGATQTFTVSNNFYRKILETSDAVFDMLAGDDYAYTGSGNDKISGGGGNDMIRTGAGNDLISGGANNDRLFGGDGDDAVYGGSGDDRLFGQNGNDEVHGGGGDDKVNGNSGDDVLSGGAGDDVLSGGAGIDFLYGGDDDDTLIGGADNDTLDGGDGVDIAYGGAGDDIINGGNGADILIGNIGVDKIYGDGGDDIIYIMTNDWSAGESIYGGTGTDELILSHASTVDFTTGTLETLETLTGSNGDQDVTLSITQLYGFTTIDYGLGTDSQTISISGTHNVTALTAPTISGLESSSIIFSVGADNLTITGAQLDSFTTGLTTLDTLGGADVVNITSTSANLNTYGSVDGNLVGLGTISASSAGAGVEISVSGQTEAFTITGGGFADTLTGGSAADIINGGNGNNILTGLEGNDDITGGTGDDIILGGEGDDTLIGGDGDDTIYGATIIGESGIETVVQTDSTTWHTVTFSATLLNPVVKMSNMTNNDGDFYSVRVRDLTETGFEWQIDEFDYLDGSRVLSEDVSWLAVSEGTHTLDNGAIIQAGRSTVTNEAQTTVTFDSAFGTAPVVLSQIISDNDSAAVVARNRSVSITGFNVNMLEEEIADGTHATEDVGWIAIDEVGSPASGFLVGQTAPTLVTHVTTTINFGGTFANTPVFVHDQQTVNGGDTSYSQAGTITTTTANVFIGEEQSRDAETSHGGAESVGYFALNEGLLTEAGGGDNTFTGGAGVDTLFGGDGADTFIFELLNAYIDNDILADFSAGEDDKLDISDLITSGIVNAGNIANYLNFNDANGTDTIIEVDGAGGGAHSSIAIINGVTGLDEATLFTNGNIIA